MITLVIVSLLVLLSLEYWKRQEKTTTPAEQARTTFAEPVSDPNESSRKTAQTVPGGFPRDRLSEAKRKNTAESTRVEIQILDDARQVLATGRIMHQDGVAVLVRSTRTQGVERPSTGTLRHRFRLDGRARLYGFTFR